MASASSSSSSAPSAPTLPPPALPPLPLLPAPTGDFSSLTNDSSSRALCVAVGSWVALQSLPSRLDDLKKKKVKAVRDYKAKRPAMVDDETAFLHWRAFSLKEVKTAVEVKEKKRMEMVISILQEIAPDGEKSWDGKVHRVWRVYMPLLLGRGPQTRPPPSQEAAARSAAKKRAREQRKAAKKRAKRQKAAAAGGIVSAEAPAAEEEKADGVVSAAEEAEAGSGRDEEDEGAGYHSDDAVSLSSEPASPTGDPPTGDTHLADLFSAAVQVASEPRGRRCPPTPVIPAPTPIPAKRKAAPPPTPVIPTLSPLSAKGKKRPIASIASKAAKKKASPTPLDSCDQCGEDTQDDDSVCCDHCPTRFHLDCVPWLKGKKAMHLCGPCDDKFHDEEEYRPRKKRGSAAAKKG